MIGTNLIFAFLWSIWPFGLSSSKREKLLTLSLYKVLMITNTNLMVHMVVLKLCVVDRFRKLFGILLLCIAWLTSV